MHKNNYPYKKLLYKGYEMPGRREEQSVEKQEIFRNCGSGE
jgi:hypothetical protein